MVQDDGAQGGLPELDTGYHGVVRVYRRRDAVAYLAHPSYPAIN